MSSKMNISLTSEVFLYSEAQFNYLEIKESLESEKKFHENVFSEVAKQWEEGQMIVDLKWHGGKNQNKEKSNVYLEQGFGTSDGICSWITPMFNKFTDDFSNLEKGSFFYLILSHMTMLEMKGKVLDSKLLYHTLKIHQLFREMVLV